MDQDDARRNSSRQAMPSSGLVVVVRVIVQVIRLAVGAIAASLLAIGVIYLARGEWTGLILLAAGLLATARLVYHLRRMSRRSGI